MTETEQARVLWIYGLPGAGKTTLARETAAEWRRQGKTTVLLDGDEVRGGLSRDLGFSMECREENIRRAAEVAALLCRQGVHVIAAFITPLRSQRDMVRSILKGHPVELRWLDCPLSICQQRQAIYADQLATHVTGRDSPFEAP